MSRCIRSLTVFEAAVEETLKFYRVYHSMRYVNDTLVDAHYSAAFAHDDLDQINETFADIIVEGKIEQLAALPEEANEPELAQLPRLKLRFNRRNLGRLRMLIDAINDTCPTCKASANSC